MHKGSGVLIPDSRVERSTPAPRLRLLVEWESRPRVFFSNLADLLLFRQVQQPFLTSRPAAFWPDVFVPSGHPWFSFLESSLGHLLLIILVVWAQSRIWEPVRLFPQRDAFRGSITYTPPAPSFQASEGRVPKKVSKKEARARAKHTSPHQRAMAVRREPTPGIVTPPDLKQAMASSPNLPDSHPVTPMAPFSATTGARRNALVAPSGVVAPPPQVDQAATRPLGLPQASGVAPAPELGAASARRNLATSNSGSERIVPPPPSVQNAGNSSRRGGISSMSGTGASVVPPPPSVQAAGNAAGDPRLGSMAGAGSQVVPPPPSVQGGGNSAGTGRGDWPYATGSQVVPPAPSIQSAGGPGGGARSVGGLRNSSGTGGRAGSLSGDGSQVIPPPPSVGGAGNGSGLGGRAGSLSGDGSQVIPPPPSVGGGGNGSGLGGRTGSLSGDGSQVIPPPPSVGGGGGGSGVSGRLGSLSGDGSQVVPPPPSVGGGGGSGTGGRLGALSGEGPEVAPPSSSGNGSGNGSSAVVTAKPLEPLPIDDSPTQSGKDQNKPAAEEVPLSALGLVFAAPGTSFFSNFEVFVAKRRMGKDKLVLMKLVYEFLPYQRRLSEYHLDDLPPRVIKLKVTPDPSCNETLGHMIEPHPNANSAATESAKLPEELRSADMNAVLPCYRTTADDFQKAMARAR